MLVALLGFLRRDFLFQMSYKVGMLYSVGSVLAQLLTVFFVSRLFGDHLPKEIARYGRDYFSFALVGLAFLDYMYVSMQTFSQHIRIAQLMGTLEAMLQSPLHPFAVIAFSGAYTYLWTVLRSMVFIIGGVLLGADMSSANILSALVFVMLIVLAFSGIGIASSAMTLYLKQSDPLTGLLGGISFLLGGIVFPVQSLPSWLQKVAWFLPMTHAVEGLRLAILQGQGIFDLLEHAGFLVIWTVFFFPLAFFILKAVIKALSAEGSFGAY
jgi:ABC-2 type transport system permease protein